jgi:hypothetical protein
VILIGKFFKLDTFIHDQIKTAHKYGAGNLNRAFTGMKNIGFTPMSLV